MSIPCASADVSAAEWWEYDPFHVALDRAETEDDVRRVCIAGGLDAYGVDRVVSAWRLTRGPTRPIVNRLRRRPS